MGVTSLGRHTRPACTQGFTRSLKLWQECRFNSCVRVFFIPMGSREFYDHIWALWRHLSHMGQMRDSDWSRENFLRSDWLLPSVAMITTNKEILIPTKNSKKHSEILIHMKNFQKRSEILIPMKKSKKTLRNSDPRAEVQETFSSSDPHKKSKKSSEILFPTKNFRKRSEITIKKSKNI